jgi:hypothetical protein
MPMPSSVRPSALALSDTTLSVFKELHLVGRERRHREDLEHLAHGRGDRGRGSAEGCGGAGDAQMAELVDAPASGAGTGNGVEVRVLFWAPLIRYGLSLSKKVRFSGPFFVSGVRRCPTGVVGIRRICWYICWRPPSNGPQLLVYETAIVGMRC